jgi:anti-sigma factor RsiW
MITCRDLSELVTDYVEGRMSWWTRARFEWHLGQCSMCRRYLAQVRATTQVAAVAGANPPPMPADVEAEMLQRFRAWKTDPRP